MRSANVLTQHNVTGEMRHICLCKHRTVYTPYVAQTGGYVVRETRMVTCGRYEVGQVKIFKS